ncbi:Ras guanine nucleotide exchange factor, putative [Entamoeba histolytica HM-3:IMSS]|uniref:Ras guanine nucleotide exchange factor, putative n=1 Tax=Entamoeba histolytica HM-3:IMSS TaxID=885315 RepID=M7W6B7_ENTHI|nr:Ras guanine nucleotide exchange factor, putative [Entamoeba histolytica HM-3:IMSS]
MQPTIVIDPSHKNRLFHNERSTTFYTKSNDSLVGYLQNPRNYMTEQRIQIRLAREVNILKNGIESSKFVIVHNEGNGTSIRRKEIKKLIPPGYIERDVNGKVIKGDVRGLIECFCSEEQNGMMKAFIWTYTGFCSTQEMLEAMIERYEVGCNDDSKPSLLIRARVISAVKYWIENIWGVIKENESSVNDVVDKLLNLLKSYGMVREHHLIKQCYQRIMNDVEVEYVQCQKNVEQSIPSLNKIIGRTLNPTIFQSIHPIEYARQITLIVSDMFRRIRLYEMLMWSNGEKESCQNIVYAQTFFNGLQNHFTRMILNETETTQRAAIIERLVRVADYCFEYHNFDTLLCILLLFNTSSIHRLKRSFDSISGESKKILNKLIPIACPDKNWNVLREESRQLVGKPTVPYIGLILSDLTFTNFGNKTKENEMVNFGKCRQIAHILEQVMFMHQQTYAQLIIKNIEIQAAIISDSRYEVTMSDKEAFDLSLKIEPRTSSIVPLSAGCTRLTLHYPGKELVVVAAKDANVLISQMFWDAMGVDVSKCQIYIFYTGNSINETMSPSSPVGRIKIAVKETEVIVTALQKVLYVNLVMEYNKEVCKTTIPLDPTLPLNQLQPILQTFTVIPSYPILLKGEKVIGCMCPSLSLDEIEWIDGDTIYLLPLRELKSQLGDLLSDRLRFKSARFYNEYVFHLDNVNAIAIVVDVMVIIYVEEHFKAIYPIELLSIELNVWKNTISFRLDENYIDNRLILAFTSPLTLKCDLTTARGFIKRICQISRKQRYQRLFGTDRHDIECSNTGAPKQFERLIEVIYNSEEFTKQGYFDVRNDDCVAQIRNFEEHGIIRSPIAGGLLVMYLLSLNEPMIPIEHTKHFVSFDFLDKEDRIELLRRAFDELTDTMRPIVSIVIQLLSLHFSFSKDILPQGFAPLLFYGLTPGLSERILSFLILNSSNVINQQPKVEVVHEFVLSLPSIDFLPTSTVLQINAGVAASSEASSANELIAKKNARIIPHLLNDSTRSLIETPRRHVQKRRFGKTDSLNLKAKTQLTFANLSDFQKSSPVMRSVIFSVGPQRTQLSPSKLCHSPLNTPNSVSSSTTLTPSIISPLNDSRNSLEVPNQKVESKSITPSSNGSSSQQQTGVKHQEHKIEINIDNKKTIFSSKFGQIRQFYESKDLAVTSPRIKSQTIQSEKTSPKTSPRISPRTPPIIKDKEQQVEK